MEFSTILFVHELGHLLAALIFKFDILRIIVLPFGMILEFKSCLNKPIYQEFIVLIMGPLVQIIFNYFFPNPYSNFLLFINLLPIYPLDGSKFLFLMFNKITSYYFSYVLIYSVSIFFIIYFLFSYFNLIYIIMLLYLLYHILGYIKNLNNTLILFCYERYKNNFYSLKTFLIRGLSLRKMRRDKYHLFLINKKICKEQEILAKMFDK